MSWSSWRQAKNHTSPLASASQSHTLASASQRHSIQRAARAYPGKVPPLSASGPSFHSKNRATASGSSPALINSVRLQ